MSLKTNQLLCSYNKQESLIMEITSVTKFYIIYHNLLENKNEKQFVMLLADLIKIMTLNEFNEIKNIKGLIFNLEKEQLLFSYKMSLLVYIRYSLHSKLKEACERDFDSLESIVNKLSELQKYDSYMNSYKTLPQVIKPLNELNISASTPYISDSDSDRDDDQCETLTETKLPLKDMCAAWYLETRLEIINRFFYLREYFGLESLQKFKIKNATYEEICKMPYKKLCKLYNKIITKIKKELKKQLQLCEAYLEVEKQFIVSMLTSNTELDLDNFSLVIEEEVDFDFDMEIDDANVVDINNIFEIGSPNFELVNETITSDSDLDLVGNIVSIDQVDNADDSDELDKLDEDYK